MADSGGRGEEHGEPGVECKAHVVAFEELSVVLLRNHAAANVE